MSQTSEDVLDSFRAEPMDTAASDFYGVQIPGSTENSPVVLRKLPGQKTLVSVSPQLLFKKFRSYTDASKFSQFQLAVAVDGHMKKLVEPRSVFPTPTADDRERFCEAIRTAGLNTVRLMLWRNPRLLIGGDDSTQFYKGTWRQTPLHMALGCEREELRFALFRTIMEVAENPLFVASTQSTPYEDISQRCQMVITSMLNNRNKRSEAVLDCAVAARLIEIVDFLVVHPVCGLAISHRTPAQWKNLAESKTAKGDVKHVKTANMIADMLNNRWYLPVFAPSELFPGGTLGNPLPIDKMQEALQDGIVEAFFGPAKKDICFQLRDDVLGNLWTQGRSSPGRAHAGSRSESPAMGQGQGDGIVPPAKEVRLYEACRDKALHYGGVWKEWWSFLESFVDRTARTTLVKLEKLFAERRTGYHEEVVLTKPLSLTRNLDLVEALSEGYTKTCHAYESSPFSPSASEDEISGNEVEVFYTPPSSPVDDYQLSGYMPESSHRRVFLGGCSPSAVDYFVFEALKDVPVPENLFCVRAWKSAVKVQRDAKDLIEPMSRLQL